MRLSGTRTLAAFAGAGILFMILWGLWRPMGIKLDFANFYDAGQKARAGAFGLLYDQNALIAGQEPLGHMSFFSAPVTAWLYAPMAGLPPYAAMLAFKAAGALAIVAGLLLLWRHLLPLAGGDTAPRDRFLALLALAALVFQPFWTIFRVGGQTTPFVFLLTVLTLMALASGRTALAALGFAAAVLVKPVLAPAAILLFVLSDNRFRLTALAVGLATAALSLWLYGIDLHRAFLAKVLAEGTGLLAPWMNSGPFSFIDPWLAGAAAYAAPPDMAPAAVRWTGLALRTATAVALLAGLARILGPGLAPRARAAVILHGGLLVSLVLSPVVWAHYLTFLFPLLATIIALRAYLTPGARLLTGAILALGLFQNEIFADRVRAATGFDGLPEIAAFGLLRSLPLLLTLLLLWIARRDIADALRDPGWR